MQSNKRPGQRPAPNRYVEDNQKRTQRRDRRRLYIILGALCAVLPPAGLVGAWRSQRVGLIARAAFTLAALCSVTLIGSLYFRLSATDTAIRPVPVVPSYMGYDSAAALPTVEPVEIYSYIPDETDEQATTYDTFVVTYNDGTTEDLTGQTDEAEGAAGVTDVTDYTVVDSEVTLPVDPAQYVTIVYAVTNNATYFHTQRVCDYQTNSRVLTLDEARAEGLQPCEKCAQEYIGT